MASFLELVGGYYVISFVIGLIILAIIGVIIFISMQNKKKKELEETQRCTGRMCTP